MWITSDGDTDDMIEKLKISMSLSKDEYEIMGYNCRQTVELFDFASIDR